MLEIRSHISNRFIRLFSERPREDLESINDLLAQLSDSPRQLNEQKLKELIRQPNFFLLAVRTANDNIVGMASLVVYETLMGRIGVIEDVVVDQNHSGRDIAECLMIVELIKTARKLNVHCVDLTSHPDRMVANKLYQKLGFQKRDSNFYRLTL